MFSDRKKQPEEIEELRSNASQLAASVQSLLSRIQEYEKKDEPAHNGGGLVNQKVVVEDIEVDGEKRRMVVTERVLSSTSFLTQPRPNLIPINGGKIISPAYQSKLVTARPMELAQMEFQAISGQLVVTKTLPAGRTHVQPGDTIIEIDGRPVSFKEDLVSKNETVTLLVVPAPLHMAPAVYYRVLADYDAEQDDQAPCKWLQAHVCRGDVIQILSNDGKWMQARKVNDLSHVGFIPSEIPLEKVCMLAPFGRRVLVLLGTVGVGRRTLKSMLLRAAPQYFATAVPLTSRQKKAGEQEGREYNFLRKEDILQKIRDKNMIEWGELENNLYGTSAESVRDVIKSGRMCVLDCSPQALGYLYNSEFMPFVVHVAPPPLDEFAQIESLRPNRRSLQDLAQICSESEKIATGPFANHIHLTLVSRNIDVTFKRLLDGLELLRYETQWIPAKWMS
ncbi:hypothetical protein WR25_08250 isoform A [Diploscapter pachys]|uniref:Guanylate kinase-like domain-containing protein n=1 Tax=Diploscapter pachys TaxID=2018661 RepID=A0A2A2LHC3_9BILA|nr:hypothetical protein WR25_08250 isoform A [Diploscapter pachys]